MQVDCFRRNYGSSVCVKKCKFYWECSRKFWTKRLNCTTLTSEDLEELMKGSGNEREEVDY